MPSVNAKNPVTITEPETPYDKYTFNIAISPDMSGLAEPQYNVALSLTPYRVLSDNTMEAKESAKVGVYAGNGDKKFKKLIDRIVEEIQDYIDKNM